MGALKPRHTVIRIYNYFRCVRTFSGLNNPVLEAQLEMVWIGYDATRKQVGLAKRQFSCYAVVELDFTVLYIVEMMLKA